MILFSLWRWKFGSCLILVWVFLILKKREVSSLVRRKCEVQRSQFVKDIWLKGESVPVPFGSQLFAIYSFVPISFIFNTNLIVGDIYSRKHAHGHAVTHNPLDILHSSHNLAREIGKSVMTPLPFAAFFDIKHFSSYWALHKLKVITLYDYEHCLNISREFIKIKRVPEFYPIQKSEYSKLLKLSKVKFPLSNNQTVVIDSPYKFVALYSFWNDLTMLKYVHSSLKPAPAIDRVVRAILRELPSGFIAMHVRLDSDALANQNVTIQRSKRALVQHIMNSQCLTEIARFENSLVDPPAVYLITNTLGHHHHTQRKHKSAGSGLLTGLVDEKIRFLTNELSGLGFHVIHTKTTLMERLTLSLLEKTFEFKEIGDPTLIRRLLPEQLAYVDMLVSRASSCFIPSHVPSTFSYLIQRMRKMDKNQFEAFEDINNATYGALSMYRQWGM